MDKTLKLHGALAVIPSADGDAANRADFWAVPSAIDVEEWGSAKLAPDCLVENYLFSDVACLFAPGSTGKTTLCLYEAVHIALGRELWGQRVIRPGPVLYVTAEDRREFLVARLREICAALGLTPKEIATVRDLVRIDDCTKHPRRLTSVISDIVTPSSFGDSIVAGCKAAKFEPVMVQFDPLVSFGVGEARVNDSEQGLIEAARVIVAGLGCCVRYVHHTGKINAREKSTDQYTGRGGSALPDGARMVAVMQPMTPEEWAKVTGGSLDRDNGESAFKLARPKLSYAAPQPEFYVLRRGYGFRRAAAMAPLEPHEQQEIDARQALLFVRSKIEAGFTELTQNALVDIRPPNLSRDRFRAALKLLEITGRLKRRSVGAAKGAREFLCLPDGARD